MNGFFSELTADQILECSNHLGSALESHAQWLARINWTLVCKLEPPPDDIAEDAHCRCDLGKWYYGDHNSILKDAPEFIRLGDIHRDMHAQARELLLKTAAGHSVANQDYEVLQGQVTALREHIRSISAGFTEELGLVSKLTTRIFEYCPEGVMITDENNVIVNINNSFTRVTGYTRAEALGKTPTMLQSGRHGKSFYDNIWKTLSTEGHWSGEIWDRRKNGEIYLEWLSISAVKDTHGKTRHYVGVFSDITHNRENEERLHNLAYYDPLTSLPNRTLFHDRLQQMVARADRSKSLAAVMFLDLDRFKMINDTLGHKAGDTLLVETASRLTGCVRKSDVVARLGGDEFTIILHEVEDMDCIAQLADKIIDVVSLPYMLEGQEVVVTTSIGISVYPYSGTTADALTKGADIAMYEAKSRGRNNYQFFRHAASDGVIALFTLENHLRHALERNEFLIHYQPQVDIETGKINGVEALLRWQHPQYGEILPGAFLAVAEETGLIVAIGEWVIRQACAQNKAWQDMGLPPMRVAVNLSGRQLRRRNFAEKVAEILDDTGLDSNWLELELTEDVILQNAQEVLDLLNQLKSIGVWLSIDDFGIGHSSLSYLKRFPIDSVKIDKSFIRNVTSCNDDASISRAIIALANSLELKVIAEGVEHGDQLHFLRSHQCRDAQGYLFSHPLPIEAITKLLHKSSTGDFLDFFVPALPQL